MEPDFKAYHERLFKSDPALKLGRIHCALLLADNSYRNKAFVHKTVKEGEFNFTPVELTLFGKETIGVLVKWWVRKKVGGLGQIDNRITEILPHLNTLKRKSLRLSQSFSARSYEGLIDKLKIFAEEHKDAINRLNTFVLWLRELDEISPCVLFTHPPWSTTQISDRYLKIEECIEKHIHISAEIVFGLWHNGMPTWAYVRNYMESDWADAQDPEYMGASPITYNVAFPQAANKILYEFSLYFQKIRDSVEMLQSVIDDPVYNPLPESEEPDFLVPPITIDPYEQAWREYNSSC